MTGGNANHYTTADLLIRHIVDQSKTRRSTTNSQGRHRPAEGNASQAKPLDEPSFGSLPREAAKAGHQNKEQTPKPKNDKNTTKADENRNQKQNPGKAKRLRFKGFGPKKRRSPERQKCKKNAPKKRRKNSENQGKKGSKKKSPVKPNACVSKGLARKTAKPRKPENTKNGEKTQKGKKNKTA